MSLEHLLLSWYPSLSLSAPPNVDRLVAASTSGIACKRSVSTPSNVDSLATPNVDNVAPPQVDWLLPVNFWNWKEAVMPKVVSSVPTRV